MPPTIYAHRALWHRRYVEPPFTTNRENGNTVSPNGFLPCITTSSRWSTRYPHTYAQSISRRWNYNLKTYRSIVILIFISANRKQYALSAPQCCDLLPVLRCVAIRKRERNVLLHLSEAQSYVLPTITRAT